MSLTARELWSALHGIVFGSLLLTGFVLGLAGLYGLTHDWLTAEGARKGTRYLVLGTWMLAVIAWITVITGTYILHPLYHADSPTSPETLLTADPGRTLWHTFGFQWKEHVGWFAPIIATAVAFIVHYYRTELAHESAIRKMTIALFVAAFGAAVIAGLFGALVNKAAPIR